MIEREKESQIKYAIKMAFMHLKINRQTSSIKSRVIKHTSYNKKYIYKKMKQLNRSYYQMVLPEI